MLLNLQSVSQQHNFLKEIDFPFQCSRILKFYLPDAWKRMSPLQICSTAEKERISSLTQRFAMMIIFPFFTHRGSGFLTSSKKPLTFITDFRIEARPDGFFHYNNQRKDFPINHATYTHQGILSMSFRYFDFSYKWCLQVCTMEKSSPEST